MKGPLYTILFMLAVSAVFGLVLGLADWIAEPRIEANELLDTRRAVLYVFELDTQGDADVVLDRFDAHVEEQTIDGIDLYAHVDDAGEPIAYALPFEGSGLWGGMFGYIGTSPDFLEMTGLVFTEHQETPGLGGRIDERQYLEQFRGIDISPGNTLAYSPQGDEDLDAITGATSTSNAVLNILNDFLQETVWPLEVNADA